MTPFFFAHGVANPETSSWAARVKTAGSSVSAASIRAHDAFITSMKSAGVWSLISRLNTFGANTLAGALVPLVSTLGNTTDTNYNFVSGDFSFTGGITGDGSTKYMDTGALMYAPYPANKHISAFVAVSTSGDNQAYMGAHNGALDSILSGTLNPATGYYYLNSGTFQNGGSNGMLLATTDSGNTHGYRNGISQGSVSYGTASETGNSMQIFALNEGIGGVIKTSGTLYGYSMGYALTGTQITAYYNALNTLMTALGRTIPA